MPLAETLDLRLAGRADDLSDIGGLASWRLGPTIGRPASSRWRGSWSAGEGSPSMLSLYSQALQSHPWVVCDPGPGSPPRTCPEFNPRQVTRVTTGNPDLGPSRNARLGLGAEARRGPYFLDVEWYRLSNSDVADQHRATWALLNLEECTGADRTNCIERTGGDITIHDSYENITDIEVTGLNTRFGGGFRTSGGWSVFAEPSGECTPPTADGGRGEPDPHPRGCRPRRHAGAARGLSTVWTVHYRSGYRNQSGTGRFKSWTGHDVVVDWKRPLGMDNARVTAGVFNVTDASLSVDTATRTTWTGPRKAAGAHVLPLPQDAVLIGRSPAPALRPAPVQSGSGGEGGGEPAIRSQRLTIRQKISAVTSAS